MICPYCNNPAAFVPNEKVYGRRYGKSYMCYYCKDCDAYVGTHENDPARPLGAMANKELRQWRVKAHDSIDRWWKDKGYKRQWVYVRLKHYFGFDVHIGAADIAMCEKIINASRIIFSDWEKENVEQTQGDNVYQENNLG